MNNERYFILLALLVLLIFILRIFQIIKSELRFVNHLGDKKYYIIRKSTIKELLSLYFETTVIMILFFSIIQFNPNDNTNNTNNTDNTDISVRIENISENLSQASDELTIIQKELEARVAYIEDLKREAEIAENVISLSEDQVNAVQAKLSQQLEESNNKSFIQSFIPGAIFFILGTVFTPLINFIFSRFRKNAPADNNASAIDGYSNEEILMAVKFLKAVNNAQNDDTSKPSIQKK